ncbi:dihydropteridine reductase QDPR [Acrasis kona]
MWTSSVQPAVLSSHLASKHLNESGLLALVGAAGVLEPNPDMIGYAIAKNAIHYLILSLAKPSGGLPNGATVIGLLPQTLDTENNRKYMPADQSHTWTPLNDLSNKVFDWSSQTTSRPKSGSLVKIVTNNKKTEYQY